MGRGTSGHLDGARSGAEGVLRASSPVGWGAAVCFLGLPTTALQRMVLPRSWCADTVSMPLSAGLVSKPGGHLTVLRPANSLLNPCLTCYLGMVA